MLLFTDKAVLSFKPGNFLLTFSGMEKAAAGGGMVIMVPKRGSCLLFSKLFFEMDFDNATRFRLFIYFIEQYKNKIKIEQSPQSGESYLLIYICPCLLPKLF
jgi:hypothetical protein